MFKMLESTMELHRSQLEKVDALDHRQVDDRTDRADTKEGDEAKGLKDD